MVSLWGKAAVAVVDLESKHGCRVARAKSPHGDAFHRSGKRLLVGCSDVNAVVMLNVETGLPKEIIRTSLHATTKNGSTPNSLAVTLMNAFVGSQCRQ